MTIIYEWNLETWETGDDDPEVLYHDQYNRLKDIYNTIKCPAEAGTIYKIVLYRDEYQYGSLCCRSYAYVLEGNLQEYFLDCYGKKVAKVPIKYINETNKNK